MDLIPPTERPKTPARTLGAALAERLLPDSSPHEDTGRYDRLVDAANRLPRPVLAFGAVALLGFAMLDPAAFMKRMEALQAAPTELWWLLGAVIAGHFGAREAHHLRHRADRAAPPPPPPGTGWDSTE